MKINKVVRLGFVLTSLLLSSCDHVDDFPRSNAFYINDQASALLSSTQYLIYYYSKELYEVDSQKEEYKEAKTNGAQVVVATYMGEPGSIDTTKIFNKWGVGQNNMGLLLMLYFEPDPNDELIPTYLGMTREIGSKLSGYISMYQLEDIFRNTWEHAMFETVHRNDYDYKLAFFYINVLKEIYTRIYEDISFDEETLMDSYDRNQYNSYYNLIPQGDVREMNLAWWVWVLIGLGVLAILGTGRRYWLFLFINRGTKNTGGGGKSHGYKYTR